MAARQPTVATDGGVTGEIPNEQKRIFIEQRLHRKSRINFEFDKRFNA